jgi:hypothetical protein
MKSTSKVQLSSCSSLVQLKFPEESLVSPEKSVQCHVQPLRHFLKIISESRLYMAFLPLGHSGCIWFVAEAG